MADIRLEIGLNTTASYSTMRSELNSIVRLLNKSPVKIKAQFDESSIKSMQSQLTSMMGKMNTASKVPVNTSAFSDLAAKATQASNAVRNMNNVVSSTSGATKATKVSLEQVISTYEKMLVLMNKNPQMAGTSQYAELSAQVSSFRSILEACDGDATRLGAVLKETGVSGATAISNAKLAMAEFKGEVVSTTEAQRAQAAAEKTASDTAKQSTSTAKAYESALIAGNRALAQGESALERWTAAEKSRNSSSRAAYSTLQSSVDALRQAQTACDGSAESVRTLQTATQNFQRTLKSTEATLRANGDATKSLTDRMGGLASKFGAWLSVSQVIMYAYRAVRNMVSASIELESAMAQMQVVTKASNEEMRKFGYEAAKVAQKTATSITDVISSSTTYARLGYSMDESKQLAEYTSMLQKVGDIDVSDAQDAITAIIKAYNIDAKDIESVMDKLVETGNNFPVSVSQLAEGMNNASSTLAAADNTFEQSVALLTAANTTIQNAAKSSTGLRTIAARIRKTTTELDDLGEAMTDADYDKLVQGLTNAGVALTNAQGEFRSTYDIMQDIASVWDKLTSMEQAGLATALSGTRQQAVFYSIIEQFKEASGAMESMSNSAGALDDAFAIVSDTTEARIERMKAKFQEMGSDLMSSDALGFFVDTLKGAMDLLDGFIKLLDKIPFSSGGVTTAVGAITAALIAMKKNIGRVRKFTLKMNMPIVTIVLFGYEQFRCYG